MRLFNSFSLVLLLLSRGRKSSSILPVSRRRQPGRRLDTEANETRRVQSAAASASDRAIERNRERICAGALGALYELARALQQEQVAARLEMRNAQFWHGLEIREQLLATAVLRSYN